MVIPDHSPRIDCFASGDSGLLGSADCTDPNSPNPILLMDALAEANGALITTGVVLTESALARREPGTDITRDPSYREASQRVVQLRNALGQYAAQRVNSGLSQGDK